ncbi:hypothetical protein ACFL0J_00535 [Candidatus Neomarinimicrobiota bacterium]
MKTKFIYSLLIFFLLSLSCKNSNNVLDNNEKDYPCNLNIENYDYSYGIKYDNPQLYLTPGTQSDLNDEYIEEIKTIIGTPGQSIPGILIVSEWFNQNFTFVNAGGDMIGRKTINELYESKTFYGCHSAALVISGILREFGFPTVMIETASIEWAYNYYDGTIQSFSGHVMTEVYVLEKWILLDNDGTYVEEYDCMNPFISRMDDPGLFTYAKGKDIWDYGVREESNTHSLMITFSGNIGCFEDKINSTSYEWKN